MIKNLSDFLNINDYYKETVRDHLHEDIVHNMGISEFELFRYRFKKRLVKDNIQIIQGFSCAHINDVINQYLVGQLQHFTHIPDFKYTFFSTMAQEEKRYAKQETTVWMLEDHKNKLEDYIAFLESKNEMLIQISHLTPNNFISQIASKDLSTKYPEVNFTNKKEVNNTIELLLLTVDSMFLKELLKLRDDYHQVALPKEGIDIFKQSELIKPIRFMEYPEDRILYNKLVKTLFAEHLQQRSNTLGWTIMPRMYQKINDLVSEYFPTSPEKSKSEDAAPQETMMQEKHTNIDFPTHIFLNAKAYQLFRALITHATRIKQVAFIYRHMAEQEKPALIVVKDADFRRWYNTQDHFTIKLENTTDTYLNAKNEDRIMAYKLLRNIYFPNEF